MLGRPWELVSRAAKRVRKRRGGLGWCVLFWLQLGALVVTMALLARCTYPVLFPGRVRAARAAARAAATAAATASADAAPT